jgi:hypothetical protein
MKTDDRLENVGGIRGRAYVMFGGKVALGTFNDGERFGGIAFAELLDKKNVGDDISNKEHYEAQVYIEVKSLDSLQALRDVLDMCESQLKDQIEKDRANTETKQ